MQVILFVDEITNLLGILNINRGDRHLRTLLPNNFSNCIQSLHISRYQNESTSLGISLSRESYGLRVLNRYLFTNTRARSGDQYGMRLLRFLLEHQIIQLSEKNKRKRYDETNKSQRNRKHVANRVHNEKMAFK